MGAIKQYLKSLTFEEGNRLLDNTPRPRIQPTDGWPCLVEVAEGGYWAASERGSCRHPTAKVMTRRYAVRLFAKDIWEDDTWVATPWGAYGWYDAACLRFGTERVNHAIKEKILRWRSEASLGSSVGVGVAVGTP